MGKALIIPSSDFSVNSLGRVEIDRDLTYMHDYDEWSSVTGYNTSVSMFGGNGRRVYGMKPYDDGGMSKVTGVIANMADIQDGETLMIYKVTSTECTLLATKDLTNVSVDTNFRIEFWAEVSFAANDYLVFATSAGSFWLKYKAMPTDAGYKLYSFSGLTTETIIGATGSLYTNWCSILPYFG